MKKLKWIALLQVVILLLMVFAGCNNDTPGEATQTPAATQTPKVSDSPSDNDTPDEVYAGGLPISDEKVSFTMWNGPYSVEAGMTSANDSFAYQEAERRTNVHIDFMHPAAGQELEQFNLLIASDNYPDIFVSSKTFYTGGFDSFIENEIILDLRDYVEKYAPDFMQIAKIDEKTWKNNLTDSGYIPGFYNISENPEPTYLGPQVRKDWLDDLGLDVPETYDDWYNMLTQFKDKKGATNGYMMRSTAGLDDGVMIGYGIINGFYHENNVVKFGPAEPAYRDYVTTMHKWYQEGLIDQDFFSRDRYTADVVSFITTGKTGAWQHFWTMFDIHQSQSDDANFQSMAVTVPKLNKGDKRHVTIYNIPETRVGTAINTISADCSDPATLVKWFNYFYSDEGALLADYGVEGQAHEIIDGKPVLTEIIYNNPDGLTMPQAFYLYTINSSHSHKYDWARQVTPTMSDYCKTAGATWDSDFDNTGTMISVTLTQEESVEYTSYFNDITTFIQERTASFIQGNVSLDELDNYFAQLERMNIARCIELQQAALERYNNR